MEFRALSGILGDKQEKITFNRFNMGKLKSRLASTRAFLQLSKWEWGIAMSSSIWFTCNIHIWFNVWVQASGRETDADYWCQHRTSFENIVREGKEGAEVISSDLTILEVTAPVPGESKPRAMRAGTTSATSAAWRARSSSLTTSFSTSSALTWPSPVTGWVSNGSTFGENNT